ncbi:mucin-17 isoform X12 [Folsomia candida]|uniref:mucin-17 isoform X12 n=1 Tax=Folsomia candida TaxID=158441 RepID=UPI001604B390|nr:mucin-17 isoform X12 [Folsomia candida]
MEALLKEDTKGKVDGEEFEICSGEFTQEERDYLVKTGQMIEKDGQFLDISTLTESGFEQDLDESLKENVPEAEVSILCDPSMKLGTPLAAVSTPVTRGSVRKALMEAPIVVTPAPQPIAHNDCNTLSENPLSCMEVSMLNMNSGMTPVAVQKPAVNTPVTRGSLRKKLLENSVRSCGVTMDPSQDESMQDNPIASLEVTMLNENSGMTPVQKSAVNTPVTRGSTRKMLRENSIIGTPAIADSNDPKIPLLAENPLACMEVSMLNMNSGMTPVALEKSAVNTPVTRGSVRKAMNEASFVVTPGLQQISKDDCNFHGENPLASMEVSMLNISSVTPMALQKSAVNTPVTRGSLRKKLLENSVRSCGVTMDPSQDESMQDNPIASLEVSMLNENSGMTPVQKSVVNTPVTRASSRKILRENSTIGTPASAIVESNDPKTPLLAENTLSCMEVSMLNMNSGMTPVALEKPPVNTPVTRASVRKALMEATIVVTPTAERIAPNDCNTPSDNPLESIEVSLLNVNSGMTPTALQKSAVNTPVTRGSLRKKLLENSIRSSGVTMDRVQDNPMASLEVTMLNENSGMTPVQKSAVNTPVTRGSVRKVMNEASFVVTPTPQPTSSTVCTTPSENPLASMEVSMLNISSGMTPVAVQKPVVNTAVTRGSLRKKLLENSVRSCGVTMDSAQVESMQDNPMASLEVTMLNENSGMTPVQQSAVNTPVTRGSARKMLRENSIIGTPASAIIESNDPKTPLLAESTLSCMEVSMLNMNSGMTPVAVENTPVTHGSVRKVLMDTTVVVTPTPERIAQTHNTPGENSLACMEVSMLNKSSGILQESFVHTPMTEIKEKSEMLLEPSPAPFIEFSTPLASTIPRIRSKTFSGPRKSDVYNKSQNISVDLLKFDDSVIISEASQEPKSTNLITLDDSEKCSQKNSTKGTEDLETTLDEMTRYLALDEKLEAEELNNTDIVKETPVKLASGQSDTPSQLKDKRLLQLTGGRDMLFSPSPPRPTSTSGTTPVFKTPINRPKSVTPKFSGSPSRYAHIQAKVDSGLRRPSSGGFSMGLDSPVANYIHSKAVPSAFQRIAGIPNKFPMSAGKTVNAKQVGTITMIPRPSLPSLTGSSKFNAHIASQTGSQTTDANKFKQHQYTGPKSTILNNFSFTEKHQKENYLAERHTGIRAKEENVDVSIVQGAVIQKKFIQSKLATPRSYVK